MHLPHRPPLGRVCSENELVCRNRWLGALELGLRRIGDVDFVKRTEVTVHLSGVLHVLLAGAIYVFLLQPCRLSHILPLERLDDEFADNRLETLVPVALSATYDPGQTR